MSFSTKLKYHFIPLMIFGIAGLLFSSSTVLAASVTLAWDKPDSAAVMGYNIYYGPTGSADPETILRSNKKVINDSNQTQYVINNLESGREYLFAATSHDRTERESEFSETIKYTVPKPAEDDDPGDDDPGNDDDDPGNDDDDPGNDDGDPGNDDGDPGNDDGDPGNDDGATDPGNDDGAGEPGDSEPGDGDDAGNPGDTPRNLPNKPGLRLPANNAVLLPGETIRLETESYFHPEGLQQGPSRWQIRRVDKSIPLYDKTYAADFTVHDITDPALLESGLRYAWRVGFKYAGSEAYSWSDERFFVVGQSAFNNGAPPVHPGEERKDFKMVSFTHWKQDECAEKTFGPLIRSLYQGEYRIAAYNATLGRHGGYSEYPDFEVVPGQAYWVLARNGMHLNTEGIPVTTKTDIHIPLKYNKSGHNGWAMIAAPNNASYAWGDIEIQVTDNHGNIQFGPIPIKQLSGSNPNIDTRIWEWKNGDEGRYSVSDSSNFIIEPHGGYWVRAKSENVTLIFPFDAQLPDALLASMSNPGSRISNLWHAGVGWVSEKLSPSSVFADFAASGEISPPMPLNGFAEEDESPPSDPEANCFISTMSNRKK